jgi:hypothetical protein
MVFCTIVNRAGIVMNLMNHRIISALAIVLTSAGVSANLRPWYDVSQDTIIPVTEYATTAKSRWYTDCWASSITTVNGSTYFAYVDPDRHIQVGQMTDGSVTVSEVESGYTTADDGHNEACVAVDKDGYIHIIGDMHNNTLRYWRSNEPGSVTAGFTRYFGAIAGTFSYYTFRKDGNNELYMYSRSGTRNSWFTVGGRGVGLYHYDTVSRTWTPLGAIPPGCTYPVIFWEDSGHGGTDDNYQMYKADVRFDAANRLHFTVTVCRDFLPNTHTHAVYACSDDGGVTFKRADGTVLDLPMRIDAGPGQADVIDGSDDGSKGMGEHAGIFLDDRNYPGVYYSIEGKTWYRYWDGSAWQPRIELNGSQWGRAFALSDPWGTQTLVHGSTWKRFEDFGVAPVTFAAGASVYRWDLEALRDYDTYRGISWNSSTGEWKIIRFDINNPTTEGLIARPLTSSRIDLNWPAEPGATGYNLKRSTNRGGPYTTIASGLTATSYSNTGLAASTAYYYTVSAVIGGIEGPDRPQVTASTYLYNLAWNKNASASSQSGTLSPNNAVDADMQTRWSSAYSDSQWIRVDLGGVYTIGSVRLRWEAAYGKAYQVQVSTNGSSWTGVYSTNTGTGGVDEIRFDPAYARYVRMLGIERGTGYGYSLYEFEVYKSVSIADFEPDGDVDIADFSTLAIDWLKTGSLVSDISGPAGTPDSVVDIYDLMEFANFWLE